MNNVRQIRIFTGVSIDRMRQLMVDLKTEFHSRGIEHTEPTGTPETGDASHFSVRVEYTPNP